MFVTMTTKYNYILLHEFRLHYIFINLNIIRLVFIVVQHIDDD